MRDHFGTPDCMGLFQEHLLSIVTIWVLLDKKIKYCHATYKSFASGNHSMTNQIKILTAIKC